MNTHSGRQAGRKSVLHVEIVTAAILGLTQVVACCAARIGEHANLAAVGAADTDNLITWVVRPALVLVFPLICKIFVRV